MFFYSVFFYSWLYGPCITQCVQVGFFLLFFFLNSAGVRSLWQAEFPDETPAGARLQGEGRGAAARHSPLVTWRAPRPARLTPAPAGQEVGRGQRRGWMEVDTGTGDNQYPMNLSISCNRMERTIDRVPLCLLLACKVVSGDTGIVITTAIIQQINDRL